ncbi:MAG: SH3 domain-containing protein [Candidatus Promineifilaceae bacterium]
MAGEPGTTQLRVTINLAYVRSGPGQNYPVIDLVPGESTVTVLAYAENGSWFNIRLSNGRSGWIGATITEPVGGWELDEVNTAATVPAPPPTPQNNCDPAYPTVCIPSPPPDLDCRDIPYRSFTVLPPDPHLFDGNGNGLGCEPYTADPEPGDSATN